MDEITSLIDSVTCDNKNWDQARVTKLNVTQTVFWRSHTVITSIHPFLRFFGDTHHLQNSLLLKNVVALLQFRERQNHQSNLPSSFLLLPTFYSQLEIEVECPLVRLQIYNLNMLCLVLCYLKHLSTPAPTYSLSLYSLSPYYNGHVKAREHCRFLLCLSGF